MLRQPSTPSRTASSASLGRGVVSEIAIVGSSRSEIRPCRRLPVLDMIEVRLSTRSGWSMVSCWAIIPPIDTPTTCAALDAEVVQDGEGVLAMSESR